MASKEQTTPVAQAVPIKDIEMGSASPSTKAAPAEPEALSLYELFLILKPYFWPTGLGPRVLSSSTWIMVGLSKASSLIAPFYLSSATNRLVDGDFQAAATAIAIYTMLRFLSSFFKEMQSILYIKVKQQAGIELQKLTFAHLHKLSLHWHLSKKTGSVMKSMDRGVEAANSLVSYLFLFLLPAIMECLAVVILFFLQFKQYTLGIVVFVGVGLYSVCTIYITQWRKKFRVQTNKHDNEFHEKATDSILNYETVKYFTNERFEIERFTSSVEKYQVQVSATTLSLSLLNVTQQFILNLTMIACMLISGVAVANENMSIGGWIAVQSWVTTIFVPLNFLGTVYGAIYQGFIDIRNLSELLAQGPDILDKPGAVDLPLPSSTDKLHEVALVPNPSFAKSKGVSVEFRDVVFHYQDQPPEKGLQHVSFTVQAGTTTALVGHTGSGKTTLSRLLFRFYDPISGSVLVNGHNIKEYTQKSVRQCIGVVPQDTVLFNDTILHNVRYGRMDATMEEVIQAAESAQILAFIESLPEKWDTVVGERGLKLSGGEKQRVAIARCLLKNPPIVLLDEATSALDTLTEYSIQEALLALGQNRTVIVIAHRLSTIRNAQQIVVMGSGKVLEKGSHDELLREPNGVYRVMWEMQLRSSHEKPISGGEGEPAVVTNEENV